MHPSRTKEEAARAGLRFVRATVALVCLGALGTHSANAQCISTARCITVLASARATSLVVDSSRVFWTDKGSATIQSASKYGGVATTLVRSETDATLDGVEGTYVYWHTPYAMKRIPALGGIVQALYSYDASRSAMIVSVAITPSALFSRPTRTLFGSSRLMERRWVANRAHSPRTSLRQHSISLRPDLGPPITRCPTAQIFTSLKLKR